MQSWVTSVILSPRFLHVTKFKIHVTNWTISVIFRFPQYYKSTEKWNQTCFKTYLYITQIAHGQHWHKLDLTSYNSARKHVLVGLEHIIVNRSINYVNRNNRVKCQHLPGTGTRARGDWPYGFELSILALKIEYRPRINARMDLFSGWLLLNDQFSLLYFANQHKSRTFYTIFHYFVAFFTHPWATPNSVNFPVFSVSWRNRGLMLYTTIIIGCHLH